MKLQNRAILQFRLLGTWGENLIWAFLQREEAGPGEAEKLPVHLKPRRALQGPGSLPSWAGAVKHAPFTRARAGHGWSIHTPLHTLNQSVHKHFMYMCPDLCLFRHCLLWAQIHAYTQAFLCIWSHSTILYRGLCTPFTGVILQRDAHL